MTSKTLLILNYKSLDRRVLNNIFVLITNLYLYIFFFFLEKLNYIILSV